MADERVERKLAAIFEADMVGYSRLMEADETGTIVRQKALRVELIDPSIANNHGRIVKVTGDAMLVEFASVVDAVQCAVEVQRGMAARNAGVPEDRQIQYRIGINLGDVIIDGEDILGEGVNIAARLEGLAEPGGVCSPMTWTRWKRLRRRCHSALFEVSSVLCSRPTPHASPTGSPRRWCSHGF